MASFNLDMREEIDYVYGQLPTIEVCKVATRGCLTRSFKPLTLPNASADGPPPWESHHLAPNLSVEVPHALKELSQQRVTGANADRSHADNLRSKRLRASDAPSEVRDRGRRLTLRPIACSFVPLAPVSHSFIIGISCFRIIDSNTCPRSPVLPYYLVSLTSCCLRVVSQ